MALKTPATPLIIALTQGGADAFVQGSVLTGLTGRVAYNVKAIFLEILSPGAVGSGLNATDSEITISLTRRSKTAIPNMSDTDVIYKKTWAAALTTSGAIYVPDMTHAYFPPLEVPLVEDTIYAQLDSTATGLTILAIARMDVEVDTMSDLDRLNLITRSLT